MSMSLRTENKGNMSRRGVVDKSVWTLLGVWSLGYGIQFQTWGLQERMALPSMLGIQL